MSQISLMDVKIHIFSLFTFQCVRKVQTRTVLSPSLLLILSPIAIQTVGTIDVSIVSIGDIDSA